MFYILLDSVYFLIFILKWPLNVHKTEMCVHVFLCVFLCVFVHAFCALMFVLAYVHSSMCVCLCAGVNVCFCVCVILFGACVVFL